MLAETAKYTNVHSLVITNKTILEGGGLGVLNVTRDHHERCCPECAKVIEHNKTSDSEDMCDQCMDYLRICSHCKTSCDSHDIKCTKCDKWAHNAWKCGMFGMCWSCFT